MPSGHQGVAIGGPKAGQWLAGQSRRYVVEVAERRDVAGYQPSEEPPIQDRRTEVYEYTERFGVGFWLGEGLGIEGMMRELLTHYRPTAFRDQK